MRTSIVALAFVGLISVGGIASAKGCIKGAAVGGVAGHVVGKHGVLGAAAGCVVGRHQANKKDRQEAVDRQAAASAAPNAPAAPVKQ
jgi:outer membrane lipoprotein SlyB